MRAGEKLHELMIGKYETSQTIDCDNFYVIIPSITYRSDDLSKIYTKNCSLIEYSSENNNVISEEELNKLYIEFIKSYKE
jgi:FlaA1/EpsC-like NDP-sugar epimerase